MRLLIILSLLTPAFCLADQASDALYSACDKTDKIEFCRDLKSAKDNIERKTTLIIRDNHLQEVLAVGAVIQEQKLKVKIQHFELDFKSNQQNVNYSINF